MTKGQRVTGLKWGSGDSGDDFKTLGETGVAGAKSGRWVGRFPLTLFPNIPTIPTSLRKSIYKPLTLSQLQKVGMGKTHPHLVGLYPHLDGYFDGLPPCGPVEFIIQPVELGHCWMGQNSRIEVVQGLLDVGFTASG